jgi:hypothetical protein
MSRCGFAIPLYTWRVHDLVACRVERLLPDVSYCAGCIMTRRVARSFGLLGIGYLCRIWKQFPMGGVPGESLLCVHIMRGDADLSWDKHSTYLYSIWQLLEGF